MQFLEAKRLFEDRIRIEFYVSLFESTEIELKYAISEKEKIVVLYGEAGSGKTFLMKKVFEDISKKNNSQSIYFIANPLEEEESLDELFLLQSSEHRVVFIDEAQTLSEDKIEKLRMFADNYNYTICLATHEKEAKKMWAKKHFQTRIGYFFHLKPVNKEKIELFIASKLVNNDFHIINSLFSSSNYRLIYSLTKGNLREVNRLMYRLFDVLDYFQKTNPKKISNKKIQNKYIEIAYMANKGY